MLNVASVLGNVLASTPEFVRPPIDWHAVAPELCLLGGGAIITLVDVIWREKGRAMTSALADSFFSSHTPRVPLLLMIFFDYSVYLCVCVCVIRSEELSKLLYDPISQTTKSDVL